MKFPIILILTSLLISCSTTKKIEPPDSMFVTRKYIGDFIDFRHTGPEICGGTDLIWIRTTMDKGFGKISAYGKSCNFSAGDRIYLKARFSAERITGNWEYEIGNDSLISYRVSEFRFENKSFIRTWAQ